MHNFKKFFCYQKSTGLFWGKEEGVVEGTRSEQAQAVEAWAISVYQESKKDNPNLDEILENLRKINLQVRKLWSNLDRIIERTDKKKPIGIPSGRTGKFKYSGIEVESSINSQNTRKYWEEELTKIRASAVTLLRDIRKDKTLSNGTKRNIRMLSSLATKVAEGVTYHEGKKMMSQSSSKRFGDRLIPPKKF